MTPIPLIFDPIYSQLDLPRRHRFPIEKYQALFDRALAEYPKHFTPIKVPGKVATADLLTVHQFEYVETFINGTITEKAMKRIGFEWSQQFVNRTLTAVNGTIETAKHAVQHGIAINCTGGYHHAHPDFGSGFCVFNDLTIAANCLLNQNLATRVLIFDCDVHQGDGTAVCTQGNSQIFSVSIHCEKNFPTRKQDSDWDIGVERYIDDQQYLPVVKDTLITAVQAFRPDFIIYDAGVDIHVDDDLGLLNISTAGVYQRDKMVFDLAKNQDIPIMAVIGGGYQRDIQKLTNVHMQLIHSATATFSESEQ